MTYKEALELKKANEYLIGGTYNDMIIDDLVVAPMASDEWSSFLKAYIYLDYDGIKAINNYINSDLHVVALFGRYMDNGYLMVETLDVLLDSLKIK